MFICLMIGCFETNHHEQNYVIRNPYTKNVAACPSSQTLHEYDYAARHDEAWVAQGTFIFNKCVFFPNNTHVLLIRHITDDTAVSINNAVWFVDYSSVQLSDALSN